MDLQLFTKIVSIIVLVGPPILYLVFEIKPKLQYIQVMKEESNELQEDEIDYCLTDSDPYKE